MAKKKPVKTQKDITNKKVFLSHTGSKYEVLYVNGEPLTCQCVYSESGLILTFQPYGIDKEQINKQVGFNLWQEIK